MKKLFLMTFMAVAMTANAENKNEVLLAADDVVSDEGGLTIGKKDDDDDNWSMHFALGVNIPSKADGNSFAPFRSWEFNWTIVQYDYTPGKSKTTLSAGLGFNWRAYTLSGHKNGFFKSADYVGIGEVATTCDDFSSNIQTTSLSIPLKVKQRFSKSFAVSLGAQLNWNYYARIHNYMEQGNDEVDTYTKKIGQRPFTVDVLGILHFGKIGVYCKYSPMSVLKKDRGVEFESFAAGIYF